MQETILKIEDANFSVVDQVRRTIKGLVVPWNAVSSPQLDGRRFRFNAESLKMAAVKFVRLFQDHNTKTAPFGRGFELNPTEEGLEMTFQVYEGPQGDSLLQLAASGVKTGLSIGMEYDESDIEPDPENPGAFLVKLANFKEVSLVGDPSFPQSTVRAVMFSANPIGENMEDIKNEEVAQETPAASDEPTKVEFSMNDLEAMVRRINNEQEKPVKVEPRATAATSVTEPANYVFSKNGDLVNGKFDFGLDIVQGLNTDYNDLGARQRVQEFIDATFAAEGIVTSNVNELAPTRNVNRYIDRRNYRSPVFEAIRKGTVSQMNGGGTTPFSWPVYSSSSGLVAAGVEGEEPTVGTFVTSSATVTPTTLRGKAAISREMWDAGGVPNIGNVIFSRMVQDYQDALEAKIVATLDAASPTSLGSFTPGGGTTGQTLTAQMRSNLAGLQFVRGGFSMGYLFAQADLFTQLAGALDTTGRPILPAVGPTNADGTARSRWGSLDINGVTVLPAWALAAAGQTTAASSYLIDPTAVDGWADTPRRLFFDVAVSNVYLGIWGYAATVINDIAGVREVIYDPTA